MERSEGAEGDPQEAQRENPPAEGTPRTRRGPPASSWSTGDQQRTDGNKGEPPTQQHATAERSGGRGKSPRAHHLGTPPADRAMEEDGQPLSHPRAQTAREQEETGDGLHAPTAREPSQEEGGDTPVWQRALPSHSMPDQEDS